MISLANAFSGKSWIWWVTFAVVTAIPLGMIVWDLVPATNKASGDTISEFVKRGSHLHMIVPAFIGVLSGHFFSPFPILISGWRTIVVLSLYGCLLILLDAVHWKTGQPGVVVF